MDTIDGNAPLRWTLTQNAPLQGLNTFHVQANAEQLLELHDAALPPEVVASLPLAQRQQFEKIVAARAKAG